MKVKVWTLLGLLFAAIVICPVVNMVHAFEVTATITLENPGGYYGIAYDSGKGEIFVTYSESNRVSVISDSSLPSVSPSSAPSPSPTVPEFTPAAILILAIATYIIVVAFRKKH
jgi:DNA-binding beta-propeller fold protein YncE